MPETLLRLHFLSLLLLCSCAFLSSSSTIDVDDVVVGLVACRSRQFEAFTQFTNEFDTRWCNHSDYSNGVWCDNSTGAVTKIQLTACLSGTLKPNSSLFGYHQLRHLDLSNNNFISSTLPSKFGNLNRLEVLILSSNGLLGQVPSSINYLSHNLFTGTIPSSIFTMPSLFYLNVNDNHLTGPHEVPNSSTSSLLSYLKSLLDLYLSGNSLLATSLSADSDIPPNLETLDMSDCDLTEINGKIPKWLWSLPRLSMVLLSNNFFNGFQGPRNLLVDSSVQMLDMGFNHFEGEIPLPPLSINTFYARNNTFTGDIPLSFCNRTSLTVLDLSYNNFTGPIPQCLNDFMIVKLRKNNLEGSLPDRFNVGTSLRTIDVGENRLTGKLPRSFLNCSSLKFSSVDHNIGGGRSVELGGCGNRVWAWSVAWIDNSTSHCFIQARVAHQDNVPSLMVWW
ncbi:unnamed protein product [Brassica oleracea]